MANIDSLQRQLDDARHLGRKRADGTYFFPRTRKARWLVMMNYYDMIDDGEE